MVELLELISKINLKKCTESKALTTTNYETADYTSAEVQMQEYQNKRKQKNLHDRANEKKENNSPGFYKQNYPSLPNSKRGLNAITPVAKLTDFNEREDEIKFDRDLSISMNDAVYRGRYEGDLGFLQLCQIAYVEQVRSVSGNAKSSQETKSMPCFKAVYGSCDDTACIYGHGAPLIRHFQRDQIKKIINSKTFDSIESLPEQLTYKAFRPPPPSYAKGSPSNDHNQRNLRILQNTQQPYSGTSVGSSLKVAGNDGLDLASLKVGANDGYVSEEASC